METLFSLPSPFRFSPSSARLRQDHHLSPRRRPPTISPLLPAEPCPRPGGDAPVSSSCRRSCSSLPKQLLHFRKPKRWSFRRPLSSLWFPLHQVCPRSPVPPAARDIGGVIILPARGAGAGCSPTEPFRRGVQEGNAVFIAASGSWVSALLCRDRGKRT